MSNVYMPTLDGVKMVSLVAAPEQPFEAYPKTPRLFRDIVITEKLDGTNSQIFIGDDGQTLRAGSRNRWLTQADDNFGFARWCAEHKTELLTLGPGRHFGEWFGSGIQRTYGLKEKRFALFNVHRWVDIRGCPLGTRFEHDKQDLCPACCTVVPTLYRGPFAQAHIDTVADYLRNRGSIAVPGFARPEGIIVYHTAAKQCFKVLLENDGEAKGE